MSYIESGERDVVVARAIAAAMAMTAVAMVAVSVAATEMFDDLIGSRHVLALFWSTKLLGNISRVAHDK
jgi:hypothetical protein